jgi:hypothetical protein
MLLHLIIFVEAFKHTEVLAKVYLVKPGKTGRNRKGKRNTSNKG